MSADKLRLMRKNAGKTVTEMGRHLGLSAPAYRRYERGEVDPKISQCKEIVDFLGCKLEDIWGSDEIPREVDVTYKARRGQTVLVKVEYDDEADYQTPVTVKPRHESKNKTVNGDC